MNYQVLLIVFWPLVTSLFAVRFHARQNSNKGWTGGPISWPKAFWLAFTVNHWFVVPIFFLLHPEFPEVLRLVYYFHLASWWIRGPLELVMIYRWLNWTPYYGIGHDIFHVLGVSILLMMNWPDVSTLNPSFSLFALTYVGLIIFTTIVEAYFAYLFLNARSKQEVDENIYFASEDPKWRYINKVTRIFVSMSFIYLVSQSLILTYQNLK